MNSSDLVSMGIRNLFRRKTRTILTVLGVVIGTASIVVMLSLGIAMNQNFETQLQNMGSLNTVDVTSNKYAYEEKPDPTKKTSMLDDKNLAIIEQIEHVEAVMPVMQKSFQLTTGRYMLYANVNGIDFSKIESFGYKIEQGSIEKTTGKYPMIFGFSTKDNFYNPKARGNYQPVQIDLLKTRLTILPDSYDPQKMPKGIKVTAAAILK